MVPRPQADAHEDCIRLYTRNSPVTKHLYLSFLAIANLGLHLLFIVTDYTDANVCRPRE